LSESAALALILYLFIYVERTLKKNFPGPSGWTYSHCAGP